MPSIKNHSLYTLYSNTLSKRKAGYIRYFVDNVRNTKPSPEKIEHKKAIECNEEDLRFGNLKNILEANLFHAVESIKNQSDKRPSQESVLKKFITGSHGFFMDLKKSAPENYKKVLDSYLGKFTTSFLIKLLLINNKSIVIMVN